MKKKTNALYSLRSDLRPIIETKRGLDLRNLYDRGDGRWYKGDKDKEIPRGVREIKKMIIALAEKYQREDK